MKHALTLIITLALALALARPAMAQDATPTPARKPLDRPIVDVRTIKAEISGGNIEIKYDIIWPKAARGIETFKTDLLGPDYAPVFTISKKDYLKRGRNPQSVAATASINPADLHNYAVAIELDGHTYFKRFPRSRNDLAVNVLGQRTWLVGNPVSLRVIASDEKGRAPRAGVPVEIAFFDDLNNLTRTLYAGITDSAGTVAPSYSATPADAGKHRLRIRLGSGESAVDVIQEIEIKSAIKVLLSSDKPYYQPNETMHLRTMALRQTDLVPIADATLTFEIADAKGNKVFKSETRTSGYGIAAADFQIADEVNEGAYTLRAMLGDLVSEKTVTVKQYVLPKFKIAVNTERPYYLPGQRAAGVINAKYHFGKPIQGGHVTITASAYDVQMNEFAKVEGETDDDGNYNYSVEVPQHLVGQPLFKGNTQITLEVAVRDKADHAEKQWHDFTVARDPIQVEILPESGGLVPGVQNEVFVLTSYPDNKPAQTKLKLYIDGRPDKMLKGTSDLGNASFLITPDSATQCVIDIEAEDADGNTNLATRAFDLNKVAHSLLLRTERGAYKIGESVKCDIYAPGIANDTIFVDVVKDRQTVLTKTCKMNDGHGALELPLDAGLFGALQLSAYKILPNSEFVRDTKEIYVSRADDLNIKFAPDRAEYRPGDPARLSFNITNRKGQGVPGAIGLDMVDEAVFAMSENQPGLLQTYFTLEKELLEPKVEVHGFDIETIAREFPTDLKALGLSRISMAPYDEAPALDLNFDSTNDWRNQAVRELQQLASHMMNNSAIIPSGTWEVEPLLWGQDKAPGTDLAFDPWGRPYFVAVTNIPTATNPGTYNRLLSAGPDGELNSADDLTQAMNTYLPPDPFNSAAAVPVDLDAFLYRYSGGSSAWIQSGNGPDQENWYDPTNGTTTSGDIIRIITGGEYERVPLDLAFEMPLVAGRASTAVPADQLEFLHAVGYIDGGARFGLDVARDFKIDVDGTWDEDVDYFLDGLGHISENGLADRPILGLYLQDGWGIVNEGAIAGLRSKSNTIEGDGFITQTYAGSGESIHPPVAGTDDPRIRRWFPETLISQPQLITDDTGKLDIPLPSVADAITTWRMTAQANTLNGEIGSATGAFRVFQDFFVDLDMPLSLTEGDEVTIPVAVHNYLKTPQDVKVSLEQSEWYELLDGEGAERTVHIAAEDVTNVKYRLRAKAIGNQTLTVFGRGSQKSDAMARSVEVIPDGRLLLAAESDRLDGIVEKTLDIPEDAIDGASRLFVKVYPGLFSQVLEGLDSILRMPSGCFEQTSSTSYPNILILDYLTRTKQITPAIEMKARQYVNLGYQRLFTFEVPGGGFSVFGEAPANRILTSYGLEQFTDTAKVHNVDPALIPRTQQWLAGQQKDDGSWDKDESFSHSEMWQGIQQGNLLPTAYCAQGLAYSGYRGEPLDKAMAWLRAHADEAKSAYELATLGRALVEVDAKDSTTLDVVSRLRALFKETADEAWVESPATMSFAQGDVANIEVTAAAAIVFMKADRYPDVIGKILNYLVRKKDPHGTWNSTHATVLAMKAMLLALDHMTEKASGTLACTINGASVTAVAIDPKTADVLKMIDLTPHLKKGANKVTLDLQGEGNLMYQIVARYYVPWDRGDDIKPLSEGGRTIEGIGTDLLSIAVDYDRTTLAKDDTVLCSVTVKNNQPKTADMPLIDVGVPPGFKVLNDELDKLVEQNRIEKYTATGRQVTIYLTKLAAQQSETYAFRMQARFPLVAKSQKSQVYEYYNPAVVGYAQPEDLVVTE